MPIVVGVHKRRLRLIAVYDPRVVRGRKALAAYLRRALAT